MNKLNKDWRFITGDISEEGRLMPMGYSKDLKYAQEVAERHRHKIFELREWKPKQLRNRH